MKTREYLDAAKTAAKVPSDYALAKKLEISPGAICDVRQGKRGLPLDAVYRLAIILEMDPAQMVAEMEAERETNPGKAEFWRSFLSRAALVLATVACTLVWSFSAGRAADQAPAFFGRRGKFA